jgi:uncharacterized Tic20 family protein
MSDVPQDQKTMAMLSHGLGIFTGFIAALVIWLINKDKTDQAFVIDQSKEALNFQMTVCAIHLVLFLFGVVTLGFGFLIAGPLMTIVWVATVVFCIMGGIKANEGVEYRYPYAVRLIK